MDNWFSLVDSKMKMLSTFPAPVLYSDKAWGTKKVHFNISGLWSIDSLNVIFTAFLPLFYKINLRQNEIILVKNYPFSDKARLRLETHVPTWGWI